MTSVYPLPVRLGAARNAEKSPLSESLLDKLVTTTPCWESGLAVPWTTRMLWLEKRSLKN